MSKIHRYTLEEIEFLREISQGRFNSEITELFNQKFNLNLSEKSISGARKRNRIKSGIDSKFKHNHTPWNKDLKGIYIGGKETQFKKGHIPKNTKPIGTERINKEGYTEVKVSNTGKYKWKGKHIVVWENHYGKIPKGYVVIFADRNKNNFNIDNLILISRRQLLIMNEKQLIKEDAEYTKIGVGIVKLEEKINNLKRR